MNRRTGEASKRSPFLSYAIHPLVLCLHLFVPNRKSVLSKAEGSAIENLKPVVSDVEPLLDDFIRLPPGRARLAIRPAPTGSPTFAITMGMVVVAFFAANAGGLPATTIRSTLRRIKSAASSGKRSFFPSANRYSMVIFFPSIQPSLVSSCRNASTRTALPEAVPDR